MVKAQNVVMIDHVAIKGAVTHCSPWGLKMAKNRFNIAVIAGDGIGTEVMPEGLRALSAAATKNPWGLRDRFDDTVLGTRKTRRGLWGQ